MPDDRKLKILIHGLNYGPELVGIAVYSEGLAQSLARRGHEVRVVTGKPYYPAWKVPDAYRGGWMRRSEEKGVVVCRVAHYVPSNPSGARRLVHHASYAASSLPPLLKEARAMRPDIVFSVAPSLIASPVSMMAAAVGGAKSWLHIQDFEVEAAFATGLVTSKGLVSRLARGFEAFALHRFDRVSTISPAMCAKLLEKGIPAERVMEFRNWADIEQIRPLAGPSPYRSEWGISTPHVALYSGNISHKQGIDIVVDVARSLAHRKDLTFVVCGQGPNRPGLEAQVRGFGNVVFHDLQPKERLGDLLGLATVHLLPQIAGAADLVLPSKLTNMLASGRPVVATAAAGTGLALEVEGCGILTAPGDGAQFARGIETLLDDEALRLSYGVAARRRAEERWDREAIISRLEAAFQGLASQRPGTATQGTRVPASRS